MNLAPGIGVGRHRVVKDNLQLEGLDILDPGSDIPGVAHRQGPAFPISFDAVPQVDVTGRRRAGDGGVGLHVQVRIIYLQVSLGHPRGPAGGHRQQVILDHIHVKLINDDQVGVAGPGCLDELLDSSALVGALGFEFDFADGIEIRRHGQVPTEPVAEPGREPGAFIIGRFESQGSIARYPGREFHAEMIESSLSLA